MSHRLVINFSIKLTFLVLLLAILMTPFAHAGFGITPPYVRNTSLTRNSVYEQQILLVRGNPDKPLNALISIDAPEIQDWVQVLEGTTVLMPSGEQKIPITVRVTVPSNAKFQDYGGRIRIRTTPTDDQIEQGVVSISLGAQVDIQLSVIDRVIKDFRVRRITLDDVAEGHKVGWLYFPGKIRFKMNIENTGNVAHAPTRVNIRIFDRNGNVLMQETNNTNRMKKVDPFDTQEVIAELPTNLPTGNYLVRYTIFNGEDIKQEGEMTLGIRPYGSIQVAGYGFFGLSFAHQLSILLPIFAFIILILFFIYNRRSRRR